MHQVTHTYYVEVEHPTRCPVRKLFDELHPDVKVATVDTTFAGFTTVTGARTGATIEVLLMIGAAVTCMETGATVYKIEVLKEL